MVNISLDLSFFFFLRRIHSSGVGVWVCVWVLCVCTKPSKTCSTSTSQQQEKKNIKERAAEATTVFRLCCFRCDDGAAAASRKGKEKFSCTDFVSHFNSSGIKFSAGRDG